MVDRFPAHFQWGKLLLTALPLVFAPSWLWWWVPLGPGFFLDITSTVMAEAGMQLHTPPYMQEWSGKRFHVESHQEHSHLSAETRAWLCRFSLHPLFWDIYICWFGCRLWSQLKGSICWWLLRHQEPVPLASQMTFDCWCLSLQASMFAQMKLRGQSPNHSLQLLLGKRDSTL